MTKISNMYPYLIFILFLTMTISLNVQNSREEPSYKDVSVDKVFKRVREHDFNPLNEENSMTMDASLGEEGIADLNDKDWEVRLLAVRDLIRAGNEQVKDIKSGLTDRSPHVRQISAKVLGVLRAESAIPELEKIVRKDRIAMVRSQAVIALGQMESKSSLELLRKKVKEDPSKDVRHQCELAIDQIKKQMGATNKLREAFLSLDESTFETVQENEQAPDFVLEDTEGNEWQLNQFKNKKWVVLIWIFADWCPVCHGEFQDLMKMQEAFKKANIQVFTLETHDIYRGRVMVGKELEPEYWFTDQSFRKTYTNKIWWPHLLDRAGAHAAKYGADPFVYAVHAEYINRPATVIIDPKGEVRLIYRGTFWGDRPSIKQTLEMIREEDFSYEHPQRLKTNK
ncbi:MAG: HEAT repeat domain-containing protein [Bacteroidales bacterium]|nr:HEAT repeat domain-containing protein [Bacteroidales bacterium]